MRKINPKSVTRTTDFGNLDPTCSSDTSKLSDTLNTTLF